MATTSKTTPAKHSKTAASEARPLDDLDLPDGEDVVGQVSRNADGTPAQSDGFVMLMPEGASDADKAAAWNLGGEMPPEDRIRYYIVPR